MQDARSQTKRAVRLPPGEDGSATGGSGGFEEVYLRFAPLLRKIAVRKFGVPCGEAETLVHDVFATYLANAEEVHAVEPYLIGAICNASRYYRRRSDAARALFCGETPCAATPTDSILNEVERRILLSRMLAQVGGRCRDLLQRYYVIGDTTKTIAGDMQFKPASILTFLQKCRKRALSAYRSLSERSS